MQCNEAHQHLLPTNTKSNPDILVELRYLVNMSIFAKITFDSFIKYAHWKYSQYCCDVNIQKFIANIGHKTYEGYWNSSIENPHFQPEVVPNSLDLCTFNIQDHGEYHDNISESSPLSGCVKMAVDVIDNNHLRLHGPSGVIYLAREVPTGHEQGGRADNNNSQPSPYDSGYKHGVSDAKMERMNPTSYSLYIGQPGNNLPNHTQNFTWGYITGYCSLQSCADKDGTPNPNSFNTGLRYGFNDWNQHGDSKPGGYECPLAGTTPYSYFCNGYDAAIDYENSDY